MRFLGNSCYVIGFLLILVAFGGFLYRNPHLLAGIRKQIQDWRQKLLKSGSSDDEGTAQTRVRSDDLTITEQFRDLRVGEFVEFDIDPNVVQRPEYQVTGRGRHQALNREGRNFSPRGEEYPLYVLESGRKMLFERPDGWFVFDEAIVLTGESAREFDMAGETFSNPPYSQKPRSYTFRWRGMKLTILDVGYMQYSHGGGKCHLTDGTMIKYMLAETNDGRVLYLENQKVGTDRVWIGKALGDDLTPYTGKVLRAAA